MKHATEEQLVMLYYGEAGRPVEEHLENCPDCRQAYSAIQRELETIQEPAIPERGEGYGAEVWARIQPRLERPRFNWWFTPRRWVLAGAMAAMVVAAFLAGHYWKGGQGPDRTGVPPQARERILMVAVGEHLDRSQMVLLELVNARPEGNIDISGEQERAEDLVAANRLYRQTAARKGDTAVASVLDELERVLIEIAHSPSRISAGELEQLQHRIEAQGLLFKVRVIDSQVREKTKTTEKSHEAKL